MSQFWLVNNTSIVDWINTNFPLNFGIASNMDFLAKVCSEQVDNVNNVDYDGIQLPKSKEENNVKDEQSLDFEYRRVKSGGITYVSRYHQCEYVSNLSSNRSKRCTHSTIGHNKKYCILHDKEESSTLMTPTKRTIKSPIKRTVSFSSGVSETDNTGTGIACSYNCIMCDQTRFKKLKTNDDKLQKRNSTSSSDTIIGRVTPTDNLSNEPSVERLEIWRKQQQRLIILRHASKCPHPAGECTVTPHCESMKILWNHIIGCKSQNCSTPHCASSRYLLSHYKNCKGETCPVCGPVKVAIQKGMAKLRQSRKLPYEAGVVVVEET